MGALFLRAVDAVEANTNVVVITGHINRVAVKDGNDGAGEVSGTDKSWNEQGCQQQELCPVRGYGCRKVAITDHRVPRR